jgi:hypothetical protein
LIAVDAVGRQGDDVDFRVAEEPEQVLEQDRAAAAVFQLLTHLDQGRHEEAGAQQPVDQHHHAGDEQRREGQQRHDGGGEDAPHRQRHAHQRHPPRPPLQHGDDVVQPAHGEADDEQDQRAEHQQDAPVAPARRARQDRLRRIQGPAGPGRPAGNEEPGHQHQHRQQVDPVAEHVDIGEHHVPRAQHQRDQVVAEATQEQRRQQVDHHDHPVHGDELVIAVGVDEGEVVREGQLQPHHPGQDQRHEADRQRGAGILHGDDLGVL